MQSYARFPGSKPLWLKWNVHLSRQAIGLGSLFIKPCKSADIKLSLGQFLFLCYFLQVVRLPKITCKWQYNTCTHILCDLFQTRKSSIVLDSQSSFWSKLYAYIINLCELCSFLFLPWKSHPNARTLSTLSSHVGAAFSCLNEFTILLGQDRCACVLPGGNHPVIKIHAVCPWQSSWVI